MESTRSQRNLRPATPQSQSTEPVARIPSPFSNRNGIPTPRAGSPANKSREFPSSIRPRDPPAPYNSRLPPAQPRQRLGSDVSLPPPQALQPRRRPSIAGQQQPQQVPAISLQPTNGTLRGYEIDGMSDRSRKDSNQSASTAPPPPPPQRSAAGPPNVLTPARSRNASPELISSSRARKPSATTMKETGLGVRKDPNARLSYFDPTNQQTLDRLIAAGGTRGASLDGGMDGEGMDGEAGDEVESAQDTLASVEEMIEGYEWASDDVIGRKMARGAADMIEARLLDELMALDKVRVFLSELRRGWFLRLFRHRPIFTRSWSRMIESGWL